MKILSISDVIVPFIYSPQIRNRFQDIDLIIGCGDLPYYYQEFALTILEKPLFYVRGNHDKRIEFGRAGKRTGPDGGTDLHQKVVQYNGLLLAGVEGSLRYKEGDYQYTQFEMWLNVTSIMPALLRNRILYGRYLDVFVTHSPAKDTHDRDDLTHQGISAFRWLVKTFQPEYHFHGHVHVYHPEEVTETLVGRTRVINTYGFKETTIPDYRQIRTGVFASRKT